jgi:hypothetical protein
VRLALSRLHLVAVEVRDAAVVQLFHICCDWCEFALIGWQAVFWLTSLDLVEQDTLDFSLVLQVLLVIGLVAVLTDALRSHVQLVGLLLQQILLVRYFVLYIRVIVLLCSELTDERLI